MQTHTHTHPAIYISFMLSARHFFLRPSMCRPSVSLCAHLRSGNLLSAAKACVCVCAVVLPVSVAAAAVAVK